MTTTATATATAITTITLTSPGKPPRSLVVPAPPTVNGVRKAMEHLGDTSWDVAELGPGEDGGVVAHRPPPEHRGEARKHLLTRLLGEHEYIFASLERLGTFIEEGERRAQEAETKHQEAETRWQEQSRIHHDALVAGQTRSINLQCRAIAKLEKRIEEYRVVEAHESIALCLRAYNDVLFNTDRVPRYVGETVMTEDRKQQLKADGLDYITRLIDPPIRHLPLSTTVNTRRILALALLTPEERSVCELLVKELKSGRGVRNEQQHARPDRATALHRLGLCVPLNHLQMLQQFLATNPERIRMEDDDADADLRIFAPDNSYVSVEVRRLELTQARAEQEEDVRRRDELANMAW
ncbi:hypothetical protein C8R44DRAFT_788560 [Mycena epipterygia]|nr:hypothetical protein C8R44DRAFT_788560 [Mycena epipterygia]